MRKYAIAVHPTATDAEGFGEELMVAPNNTMSGSKRRVAWGNLIPGLPQNGA
ncbi:hypothetical protein FrEUN1fDRAFT_5763 [Parafrankia sp. EUN1f]|nr:hypothetical protein FrEUN1fDRAFT_5763 [Parafrankia sp. EUN1f]